MTSTTAERIVEVDAGESLSLRQLTVAEAPTIRALALDNEDYLSWHGEFNEREFASDEVTAEAILDYESRGLLDFGIHLSEHLIGNAVLGPSLHDLEKMAAISYWVAEDYTGRGYATRAARAMVDYAFTNWDSLAVNALVRSNNHASKKVLQKAGLELVHAESSVELWSVDHPLVRQVSP